MKTTTTPILIVGAGPTGLMMAAQLSRFGVEYIIIDKKKGATIESKALGVQSRTLEIYQQMGIATKAIEQGYPAKAVSFMAKGKKIQEIPLMNIGEGLSPFPYMLILEQSKNETLLEEFLTQQGKSVQWNTELVSFEQSEEKVNAIIQRANGEQEEIVSEWIIAADGASSPIRHQLNIPFEGSTNKQVFWVADLEVEWELSYENLCVCVNRNTFNAFFPMEGERRYRVIGTILTKDQSSPVEITFEKLQEDLAQNLDIPATFSNPAWISTYRVHHRCVDNFRHNRCFLMGDAAHIHSPAGAQGMNTGLQDAYNLAWKLALVCKKQLKPQILDSYNEERLPFAQKLVHTTDRVFENIVSTNPIIRFIRLNIALPLAKYIMSTNTMRTFAYKTVSQIGLTYNGLSLGDTGNSSFGFARSFPQVGDRFPYFILFDEIKQLTYTSFELIQGSSFHFLLFEQEGEDGTLSISVTEYIKALHSKQLFKIHRIPFSTKNEVVYRQLNIETSSIFLIRPDAYIAYKSDDISMVNIEQYLQEILGVC